MPGRALPAFVSEVPEYSCRDGLVYIQLGDLGLAMPISVFEIGCVQGRAAIRDWYGRREECRVLKFPDFVEKLGGS